MNSVTLFANSFGTFQTGVPTRTVELAHEQLLVLDHRAGTRVRVLGGGVWLTEQGEPDDRHAFAGTELVLRQPGRALLGGMGRTRLELTPPQRVGFSAWRERLAAFCSAARCRAVQGLALALSLMISLGLPDLLARGFQQSAAPW
jgi:Protein of unknown function (DUF2917)